MFGQNDTSRARFALCVLALAVSLVAIPANAAPPVSKVSPQRRPVTVNNSAVLTNYWNRMRAKLQTNWQVPDGKNRVSLTATLNADGTVNDLVVIANPKEAQAEVSATEAFNRSLPFDALPQGVTRAKISVVFEYSYDPHGDGSSRVSGSMSQIQSAPAAASPAEGTGAAAETPATNGATDSSKY